ncbi:MAG: hypothetical protein HQ561_11005, partial [Desulfobacteraceae bacterium]|nr:hypothetical protein [Desulfobacteraceae bacterium]
FMRKTNAAEAAVATRINNMESQIFIADHLCLLDNGGTQYLIGCHARGAGFAFVHPLGKILQYHFTNDRVGIENPADAFKFPSAGMIDLSIHQGQLIVYFFEHFLPYFQTVTLSGWALGNYFPA